MKQNPASQSGLVNPRVLLAFSLCGFGVFLALVSFAGSGEVNRSNAVNSTVQTTWTQLGSYSPPAIRADMVMTAGPNGQIFLFGGRVPTPIDDGYKGDTWTFDGLRWTEQHPAVSPPPRDLAAAAYDAGRQYVVVFGGYTRGGALADTWTWDGTTWTEQRPAHSPPVRYGARLAFDPATGKVVLFGGFGVLPTGTFTYLGDTWTWDGTDWTQEIPALSPSPRALFGFADGTANSKPVLFGGTYSSSPFGNPVGAADTWTWDGLARQWTEEPAIPNPTGGLPGPSPRAGVHMAYDPNLGKTLLYGGYSVDPNAEFFPGAFIIKVQDEYNDTWVWNGTRWASILPPSTPGPRFRGGMAFNQAHSRMQIFGGVAQVRGWVNDTWAFNGRTLSTAESVGNWEREDLNAPGDMFKAMLAREPRPATAILFGGWNGVETWAQGLTWRWNGSDWQLLYPAHSPPPRTSGAIAYDAARGVTVLFGGTVDYPGPSAYYLASDTWTWDGTDWTERFPPVSPPPRQFSGIAYDAARAEVVLFGGANASGGALADTWTWDGNTWAERSPANSPPARSGAMMTYDPVTQTSVLFGGNTSNTRSQLNDTWFWNGTDWVQQFPLESPSVRAFSAMGYDPQSGRVILFGGCVDCFLTTYDDTWSWDGSNWTQLQPANVPFERTDAGMIDGNGTSPLLLVGGRRSPLGDYESGTQMLNDVWAFGATQVLAPTSVVSRKMHGGLGPFDIPLPLSGNRGIECRRDINDSDHFTVVFTFPTDLPAVNPVDSVAVSGQKGTPSIRSSARGPLNNQFTVEFQGILDTQTINVTLNGVHPAGGDIPSLQVPMGVLHGDVNGDVTPAGIVSNADVGSVKAQVGAGLTQSNFRHDVNVNGTMSNADVGATKAQVGSRLP